MRALALLQRTVAILLCLIGAMGAAQAAEDKAGLSPELRETYTQYKQAIEDRRYGDAHRLARRGFELAQLELPADDTRAATLAYNLGAVSLKLGRYRDAVAQLEVATERYSAAFGETAEENVLPLRRLAKAHIELEQWADAERNLVRAVSILERTVGRNDPKIADILFELVTVAEPLKQPKRVRVYGRRAINIYEQSDGDHQLRLGLLHFALARNEIELGDFSNSKKHMSAASEALEAELPVGHPQLIALYQFMSEAYNAAGMGSRAHKYRKKLRENEEAAARRG